MTKTIKQTARVLLHGRRKQQRTLLLPALLTALVQLFALVLALHAQAFPLALRLLGGAGVLLLAAACRSWLLLRQTEAALFCVTGTKSTARSKRFMLLRLPLLLSLRLCLLACASVPAVLLLLLVRPALQKGYPAVTVTLLFGCGILMAAVAWRFFRAGCSFLELAPFLLLSGVPFLKSVRLSIESLSARKRAFFRLRRSFFFWKAACVFLLPFPFVRYYYRIAFTLFALSPECT